MFCREVWAKWFRLEESRTGWPLPVYLNNGTRIGREGLTIGVGLHGNGEESITPMTMITEYYWWPDFNPMLGSQMLKVRVKQ